MRKRFQPALSVNERMWFTLAACNAGHGHVQDARRLARQQGWGGNRWFDNAERAMLLLSKKKYAQKARFGYVRGAESASHVCNIHQLYRAHVDIANRRLSDEAAGGALDGAPVDRPAALPPTNG